MFLDLADVESGTSPRAWGELIDLDQPRLLMWNIPTCVGRTLPLIDSPRPFSEHPHVRGENCGRKCFP